MLRRRRQVRLALRSMEADGKKYKADIRRQIRLVMDNADMEAALAEECDNAYEAQVSAGNFGGKLTDFLQWLLDHGDQIIAFIKQIIALFAPLFVATPDTETAPA